MALPPQTPARSNGSIPTAVAPTSPGAERRANENAVFLREVDDAVRQDQMASWARRYGLWTLIAVLAALLAIGGYLWWRHAQTTAAGQRNEAMAQALDQVQAGQFDVGDAALEPLAKDPDDGLSGAALAMRGAIADQKGQHTDAAKLFGTLSGAASAPRALRDLATIRAVTAQYDALPPQQVIDRLRPLAVPGNPWFGSAGELVGMAYLKQGRRDLAGPMFAGIARDAKTPQSLRRRARQIAGLLGVDAIDDAAKAVTDADGGGQ